MPEAKRFSRKPFFPFRFSPSLRYQKDAVKINDRKTANHETSDPNPQKAKFSQSDFGKIRNGWKGKRSLIHQIARNHSFAFWFRKLISFIIRTVNKVQSTMMKKKKKIQIEFTMLGEIPDFDMLIKISQNRFPVVKPSIECLVWCLPINHKSQRAQGNGTCH